MTPEQLKEAEALADRLASGWPVLEDLNASVFTIRNLAARVRDLERSRKPLTDAAIWRTYQGLCPFHPAEEPALADDILKFARAVEAAHGITGDKT